MSYLAGHKLLHETSFPDISFAFSSRKKLIHAFEDADELLRRLEAQL